MKKHYFLPAVLAGSLIVSSLTGCGSSDNTSSADHLSEDQSATTFLELPEADHNIDTSSAVYPELVWNNTCWNYDAENNVYYQVGNVYCTSPETLDYETLAIFVPGEYMDGIETSDGTYTCTINPTGSRAGYTADTAPIVIPVSTPGYSSMVPLTGNAYARASHYVEAGFIYVYAGCRGRDNGED